MTTNCSGRANRSQAFRAARRLAQARFHPSARPSSRTRTQSGLNRGRCRGACTRLLRVGEFAHPLQCNIDDDALLDLLPEPGAACGDMRGHIQREKRFARSRLSVNDGKLLLKQQSFDEIGGVGRRGQFAGLIEPQPPFRFDRVRQRDRTAEGRGVWRLALIGHRNRLINFFGGDAFGAISQRSLDRVEAHAFAIGLGRQAILFAGREKRLRESSRSKRPSRT